MSIVYWDYADCLECGCQFEFDEIKDGFYHKYERVEEYGEMTIDWTKGGKKWPVLNNMSGKDYHVCDDCSHGDVEYY